MVWINPYRPVERVADLPSFCGRCGRRMRPDNRRIGYDQLTGEPLYQRAVQCPKGRFDDRHEAYIVSPRPKPIPAPPLVRVR